jgi:DNA-binding response OmpR family regulator
MAEAKKTILIVDDEAPVRKALSVKLKEEGFEIIEASDGKAGLEEAFRKHPDLILLDVIMPKMSGQEMARELKKDSWGKEASIIFLTNVSDPIKMAEIGEDSSGISTVYDYLIKSDFNLDDVVKKVNKHLK